MDETPSNVVEELVRDAVADAKAKGAVPRPSEAHKYIQGIVESLDKRQESERLRIKPKPTEKVMTKERSTAQMESEYEKRLRRHGLAPLPGSWSVTRSPLSVPPVLRREPGYVRAAMRRLDEWARSADPFGDPAWNTKLNRVVAKVAKRDTYAAANMVRSAVKTALLCRRLRILAASPDWAAKVKAVNPLAAQGQLGPEKQAHAEQVYRDVVADSDRAFGPWMKIPVTPVWSK